MGGALQQSQNLHHGDTETRRKHGEGLERPGTCGRDVDPLRISRSTVLPANLLLCDLRCHPGTAAEAGPATAKNGQCGGKYLTALQLLPALSVPSPRLCDFVVTLG